MLTGVLSSALFLLLSFVLGGGWYLLRRRALLDLFQVAKSKRLVIYLSRIQVIRGGSVGVDGEVRNFCGPTVTTAEASAATLLTAIFEYIIPGMESQPGVFKTLFTRDVTVFVQHCPQSARDIPDDVSVVAVGSPGYNTVSAWAQQALNPKISFSPNNDSLVTHKLRALADPATGMVQVLYDQQNDRRVFYVGGTTEAGTQAALLYLALKWRELKRNLGKKRVFAGFVRMSKGQPELTETIH